jgi:hypothetical protein
LVAEGIVQAPSTAQQSILNQPGIQQPTQDENTIETAAFGTLSLSGRTKEEAEAERKAQSGLSGYKNKRFD